MLVVAPSEDDDAVQATRAALHRDPEALWGAGGEPRVVHVGEALPTSARRAALPIDVTRTVEALHTGLALDVCHVHEPFAPSLASAALRHSRTLNVGSFHLPAERIVATQVARRTIERVLGRLDVRTASYATTAQLMARFFPAAYAVLRPGVDPIADPGAIPRTSSSSTARSARRCACSCGRCGACRPAGPGA